MILLCLHIASKLWVVCKAFRKKEDYHGSFFTPCSLYIVFLSLENKPTPAQRKSPRRLFSDFLELLRNNIFNDWAVVSIAICYTFTINVTIFFPITSRLSCGWIFCI